MLIKIILSLIFFSLSIFSALYYNGTAIDFLVFSGLSITLLCLTIKNKNHFSGVKFTILMGFLSLSYSLSVNAEWSLLVITGLMIGFTTYWAFTCSELQTHWSTFRIVAVLIILLTSLLGIWEFSVTLQRVDAQMLDANV